MPERVIGDTQLISENTCLCCASFCSPYLLRALTTRSATSPREMLPHTDVSSATGRRVAVRMLGNNTSGIIQGPEQTLPAMHLSISHSRWMARS
jgi:hypothetical protein